MRRSVRENFRKEDLSDLQSPQSRALMWLSDSYRRHLKPNNREAIVQRYVLFMFFHSVEGGGWYNNTLWLIGYHKFSYFGTYCYTSYVIFLTTGSISMGKLEPWTSFRIFLSLICLSRFKKIVLSFRWPYLQNISAVQNIVGGILTKDLGTINIRYFQIWDNSIIGSIPKKYLKYYPSCIILALSQTISPKQYSIYSTIFQPCINSMLS